MNKTSNKLHNAPWEINTWSYIQLYRAVANTGNRSVKFLNQGQTDQAVRTWERTLSYIDELDKRKDMSDAKKDELNYLLVSFNEHKEKIEKIKSTLDVSTYNTSNDSILPPTPIRECTVCLQDRTLDQYDGQYGDHCQHIRRNICNDCVFKHTKFILENISITNVRCPESSCSEEFNHEGIHQILESYEEKTLFQRYDLEITLRFLRRMPEFIMCAHSGCDSGQLYDSSILFRRKITCLKCKRDTCSFHKIIWHTGLTCDQYDQQKIIDIATDNWINKNTKQCPKCHRNIQKNGGCNHMKCTFGCNYEFCWECLANYRRIIEKGLDQHRSTCSHYRSKFPIASRRPIYDNRPIRRYNHVEIRTRTCTIL